MTDALLSLFAVIGVAGVAYLLWFAGFLFVLRLIARV